LGVLEVAIDAASVVKVLYSVASSAVEVFDAVATVVLIDRLLKSWNC